MDHKMKSPAHKRTVSKKRTTTPPSKPIFAEELELSAPDFVAIRERLFRVDGNKVYIGGVEPTQQYREALRDEARAIQTSRLWEIFNATITQEASDLALRQSENWQHVMNAKMLFHWTHFMRNVLYTLSKD